MTHLKKDKIRVIMYVFRSIINHIVGLVLILFGLEWLLTLLHPSYIN